MGRSLQRVMYVLVVVLLLAWTSVVYRSRRSNKDLRSADSSSITSREDRAHELGTRLLLVYRSAKVAALYDASYIMQHPT
jgi:predicted metal-binding membrane protein